MVVEKSENGRNIFQKVDKESIEEGKCIICQNKTSTIKEYEERQKVTKEIRTEIKKKTHTVNGEKYVTETRTTVRDGKTEVEIYIDGKLGNPIIRSLYNNFIVLE